MVFVDKFVGDILLTLAVMAVFCNCATIGLFSAPLSDDEDDCSSELC